MSRTSFIKRPSAGVTLIETLISVALFFMFATAIYVSYAQILDIITRTRLRSAAVEVGERELEIVRNLVYADVGVQGGIPTGKLVAQKNVSYGAALFQVNTYVRNIDDPYDGTLGGVPNDTAPADYKLVEIVVSCSACQNFFPITLTTRAAPKGLENSSNNGAIFVKVFDAGGLPISGANVSVVNSVASPTVSITDLTNVTGDLQLIDLPTSTSAYQIGVSKAGYSSEQTYPLGAAGNPNPAKPHATVATQQVTSISFAIDRLATLNVQTVDAFCAAVPNVSYSIAGQKLIGTDPDIVKYATTSVTDAAGLKSALLEWDTYAVSNIASSQDFTGANVQPSFTINPGGAYSFIWTFAPKDPLAVLINVMDQASSSVADADVTLTRGSFSQTITTGRHLITQTDWSGSQYTTIDGGIDTGSVPGQVTLADLGGSYSTSTQTLISNTFDLGTSTNVSFYALDWQGDAPAQTALKFQVAANNDSASWDFTGPDGTNTSYYTATGTLVAINLNNNRYVRYKAYFDSFDSMSTPHLDYVAIAYKSPCVPSGYAFFHGLSSGTYALTVAKPGFQTYTDSALSVSQNWKEQIITLTP